MIGSLSPDVQDIATLVVLLAPGFLFITVFQSVNVAYARNRSGWEWGMHSLVLSLPLFAAFNGVYAGLDWTNKPTDPEFYLGLFAGALVIGFIAGKVSRWPEARSLQRKIGLSDPKTTWADVVGQPESYIVVHLTDGTVLHGYPQRFTDDPREEVREIFLIDASLLRRRNDADPGEWETFDGTAGLLIESSKVNYIQLIEKEVS